MCEFQLSVMEDSQIPFLNPEFWLADEPTQLVSRSIQNYIEDCDIAKTEIQNDP